MLMLNCHKSFLEVDAAPAHFPLLPEAPETPDETKHVMVAYNPKIKALKFLYGDSLKDTTVTDSLGFKEDFDTSLWYHFKAEYQEVRDPMHCVVVNEQN